MLVIHFGGPEDPTGMVMARHAKPRVWGQMVAAANVGHSLVSHISTACTIELAESLAYIESNYDGPVTIVQDLMCIDVDG